MREQYPWHREYRRAVGILVRNTDVPGEVLCVNNRKIGSYSCPGGKVEDGETLQAAARREFIEETGIVANRLICLHSLPHAPGTDDEPGAVPWICTYFEMEGGLSGKLLRPELAEEGTVPHWRPMSDLLLPDCFLSDFYWRLFTQLGEVSPDTPRLRSPHS